MRLHSTRKQTENLRSLPSLSRRSAQFIIRRNITPMRASGVLIVGLAATAGISSLAFALQHDPKPAHQVLSPIIHASPSTASSSLQNSDTSVTVENSQSSASPDPALSDTEPTVTGQATINNEVIPLTEGTVERSFTDSNGTEHTVTISVDGNSTTVQSSSSSTDVQIYSSSSSTDTNTTRGSPRR